LKINAVTKAFRKLCLYFGNRSRLSYLTFIDSVISMEIFRTLYGFPFLSKIGVYASESHNSRSSICRCCTVFLTTPRRKSFQKSLKTLRLSSLVTAKAHWKVPIISSLFLLSTRKKSRFMSISLPCISNSATSATLWIALMIPS
jgi:hypothetical protein